jgi:hypothetical protein
MEVDLSAFAGPSPLQKVRSLPSSRELKVISLADYKREREQRINPPVLRLVAPVIRLRPLCRPRGIRRRVARSSRGSPARRTEPEPPLRRAA